MPITDPSEHPDITLRKQVHVTFKSYFPNNNILQKPTENWIRRVFLGHGKLSDVTVRVYNLHGVRLILILSFLPLKFNPVILIL